jgi:hypothetical protein
MRSLWDLLDIIINISSSNDINNTIIMILPPPQLQPNRSINAVVVGLLMVIMTPVTEAT